MSNKTYIDLLNETSELIGETTQADEAVTESGVQDRVALQPLLSELQVRYTVLLQVSPLKPTIVYYFTCQYHCRDIGNYARSFLFIDVLNNAMQVSVRA